ncbi:enoyl-CoA hydratase/isomerase family protein [Bacillus sp. 2205SS5-2]|uniref:enoyl-CoA hydratase/isomerase family protein n=1 Tax=Bacillus sp. 2205SS5-2 TaxID=3109031 RepID=UPI0030079E22
MGEYVIETDKGILQFTINREKKRNAINYEVMRGLEQVLDKAKNPSIKALVIKGSGTKAFCSGGDLSAFHQLYSKEDAFGMLSKMGKILYSLATLSKPTFCYINGLAVGGGAEIATACDVVAIHENGKVGFVQGTLGITTGWGGGTLLFQKLQQEKAMEMLLSSTLYEPSDLKKMGFVQQIVESENEALEYFSVFLHHSAQVLEA